MHSRLRRTLLLATVGFFALPHMVAAQAQTAIAGVARDTTGAVLPGVTVEVSSPAIIEGTRSAVTDANGQYRIVDLRPGTYRVVFTLPGFGSIRREGIVLTANFVAPVNAEMQVGAIEETVTVTGDSPIVDVVSSTREEVLTREVLDAIPTGRDFTTMGNALPSVNMGRFDVGGNSTNQQGTLTAFGSRGEDLNVQIDGMNGANAGWGEGWFTIIYHNEADYQEMAYSTAGSNAENRTGGVVINMIPRVGGNEFRVSSVLTYANDSMQASNIDDELRAQGYTLEGGLDHLYDANFSVGGPVVRDRIWFYGSVRKWANFNKLPGVTHKDGSQAIDDTRFGAYTGRATMQVGNSRITGSYGWHPRDRPGFNIEQLNGAPEAFNAYPNRPYLVQLRATSTLTSRLLLESGYTRNFWHAELQYPPSVRQATCFVAWVQCAPGTDYGDIRKYDAALDWRWNGPPSGISDYNMPSDVFMTSLSWVTGEHNVKFGATYSQGDVNIDTGSNNGSIEQRYRNGVPFSVSINATPTVRRTGLDHDVGLYVQDSWTRGRLTLNPGIRFDYIKSSIRDQTMPAGRFAPERVFTQADYKYIPRFTDISPRLGVAYDLFGTGKTALKGAVGRYLQNFGDNLAAAYNPGGGGSTTATWTDPNRDDIAQESELGPLANPNFWGPAGRPTPDPDQQRPYQMLYNVSVQQELRPGLSATLGYYHRRYHDMLWTDNLATTHADYSIIRIPDPRLNGQTLDVYSIDPAKFGLVDQYVTNSSENSRTYHGVDLSFIARLRAGAQVQGGVNSGKTHIHDCETDDPNSLRFCDRSYAFRTQVKLSGTVPLPYRFRVSGVFSSLPGQQSDREGDFTGLDLPVTYTVTRAIAPGLVQPSVNLLLSEPDEYTLERSNQLDISFSRDFTVNGLRFRPQVDIFNAFNSNAVIRVITAYGPALLSPREILAGRLMRLNLRVDF
jgi:hypothetical protein